MQGSPGTRPSHAALVVGIDYAASGVVGERLSTVADAKEMQRVLEHDTGAGGPVWDVTSLTAAADTARGRLEAAVGELVRDAAGRHLFLYFSGHGDTPFDDLALRASDGGHIHVDWVMKMFTRCEAATVTIVLDCCYSGSAGDTGEVWSSDSVDGQRAATLRENLALMTASRRDQTARAGDGLSPFTRLLASGLRGGAADHQGHISIVDLFSFVSGYFLPDEQRPQLKINMTDVPFVVKRVEPRVSDDVLEKLTTWFEEVGDWKELTRLHEGDRKSWPPTDKLSDLQREFDEIGRVRNLGMIRSREVHEGQEEPHYWVAMNNNEIGLTPIGQWYWLKVKRRQNAARDAAEGAGQ